MDAAFPMERPLERPEALEAFRLARRRFMKGERLDMQQLASELGVDRSTLFRWVGNRDQLTVLILRELSISTLQHLQDEETAEGGLRVARIAADYSQALIDATYYRDFLRRDPEKALRMVTTRDSSLQQDFRRRIGALLQREHDRGSFDHPMSIHDLAYLIVRIIESFIYADLITGEEPDSSKVFDAVAALLRVDDPQRSLR